MEILPLHSIYGAQDMVRIKLNFNLQFEQMHARNQTPEGHACGLDAKGGVL